MLVSASRDAGAYRCHCSPPVAFLLTWNCRHIANATIFRDLQHIIMSAGYDVPVTCTPEELLGD
jgi:hypothetical protein